MKVKLQFLCISIYINFTMNSIKPLYKNVIIADDDASITELYKMLVAPYTQNISVVNNGVALLNLLFDFSKTGDSIDLIILDHAMPLKSGAEVLEQLKIFGRQHQNIKVLAISGMDNSFQESSNTASLDICFLSKPFDVEEFQKCLTCKAQSLHLFCESIAKMSS